MLVFCDSKSLYIRFLLSVLSQGRNPTVFCRTESLRSDGAIRVVYFSGVYKMKLCKDCKYAKKPFAVPQKLAFCYHPELTEINLVSGERNVDYCFKHRGTIFSDNAFCGPEGKLWEAK